MPVKKPLNTVLLVGRVCKPPALSVARSGKSMLTVILSVDRPENVPQKVVATENGHTRTEPDYPVVVMTGDLARDLAGKVQLDTNLFVSGIFQTRDYIDRTVQPPRKRVAQEVLSNNARILETPADMERAQATIDQARSAAEHLAAPGSDADDAQRKARNERKRQRRERALARAAASNPTSPSGESQP